MVNRCVVVLVCGSLFGCPPQSGNDAGPGVETALAFCQRYTSPEYACDFLPGCGAFDSRDGCLAVLGAQNGGTDRATSEFVKAVDEGWVGYDAAAGAKCLADFKSTCSQYPASCAGIFVGLKTEGQACHSSSCVTGFYCASDGGCPGTCAAKKPAGTEVRSSVMCIEGTKSHFGLPDGGFGSLCVTPVGQGQPCGDTECNDGLFCNAQKTCVKPFALGEPCTQQGTYSPECEPLLGVACQPATDGGVSRCGKLARRGEACGFCAQDLRCVIPISFPQAALGAEFEIPGIDGPVNLKIPEGTQSGREIRIRGRGVPYLNERGTGDLIVKVLVQIPRKLNRAQRELVQKLGESLNVDNQPTAPGLLEKMKDLFN